MESPDTVRSRRLSCHSHMPWRTRTRNRRKKHGRHRRAAGAHGGARAMDGSSWFRFKARPCRLTYPQSEARTWPVPGGARAGRAGPRATSTPSGRPCVATRARPRHTAHEPRARGCPARHPHARRAGLRATAATPDLGQAPARRKLSARSGERASFSPRKCPIRGA